MCEGGDIETLAAGELADPILIELLVEVGLDHRLSCLDILARDCRLVVLAPHAPAVLLKKERVALGEFEHTPDSVLVPPHPLAFRGEHERAAGRCRCKRSDLWKDEHALGI